MDQDISWASLNAGLQQVFMPQAYQLPSSPQEALARVTAASSSILVSGGRAEEIIQSQDRKGPDLRQLRLLGPKAHVSVLQNILPFCSFLEDLQLEADAVRFGKDTCMMLSTQYRLLRSVRIFGLTLRHRLPDDLDLSALPSCLRQHEDEHREPQSLKSLRFTLDRSFKVLLDALVLGPSILETLTVGNSEVRSPIHGTFLMTEPIPSVSIDTASTYDLTKPWPCRNSLFHLDFSLVVFLDRATTVNVFDRLQDLVHLWALHISLCHLKDLVLHEREHDIANGSTYQQGHADGNASGFLVQGTGLVYLSLRSLRVGRWQPLSRVDSQLAFEETDFALAACPVLRYFEAIGSWDSLMVKILQRVHPGVRFEIEKSDPRYLFHERCSF
ncbi:hypothetical protein BGX29_009175 [Mortierella sp. GBA35]|nr:hypothetical protein BGX29_009175 [Mortierella sp. GBA35]